MIDVTLLAHNSINRVICNDTQKVFEDVEKAFDVYKKILVIAQTNPENAEKTLAKIK